MPEKKGKRILWCKCRSERISADRLEKIGDILAQADAEVYTVTDLCLFAGEKDPRVSGIFEAGKDHLIIGCYDRSLKLLLRQLDVDPDNLSIEYLNFLENDDEAVHRGIDSFIRHPEAPNPDLCTCCEEGQNPESSSGQFQDFPETAGENHGFKGKSSFRELQSSSEWSSWFPLIDYTRCTACGQCADFCLFGVYEKTEQGVKVVYPEGCKTNCPACARICPQIAIVFPKYKPGGAIGGSGDIDETAEQLRQSEDIRQLLSGDIYQALEIRKNRRKSIIQAEAMKKAVEERNNALRNSSLPDTLRFNLPENKQS